MRLVLTLLALHVFNGYLSDAMLEVAGWPSCTIDLQGTPSGTITGRFTCSGGSVFAALHRSITLQPGSLQGVRVGQRSCERPGCLITICRDSQAIIRATISNVTLPGEKLPSLICLGGRTHVHFNQPLFIGNKAAAIFSAEQSKVHIEGGVFKNGSAPSGSGFIARGNSTVEVHSSQFLNNNAMGGAGE
jgi:hypothetical protein